MARKRTVNYAVVDIKLLKEGVILAKILDNRSL
ncbi:hypothetical protein AVENLUH5627_03251 [Acinetobacter venetianus]|uniref:Uncharacterized protein n=1 Tax=Acinetobacter venetianus TaxID=52133 RepID=A0A150HK35_9GAMM|nr:hypothetical protein AVENLUH5627_03251 [Acinetobacter venetianus]